MKGPHDDELIWPLQKKFLFTLLNQINDCEHHLKSIGRATIQLAGRVSDGNRATIGWGEPQFISSIDLLMVTPTCQYLKDNCILISVDIHFGTKII